MTPLPNHWPQRAYRSTCGCVHFYPSHIWRTCNRRDREEGTDWYDDKPMGDCASMYAWEHDFTEADRLSDAEAAQLWATRPKGDKETQ